jgi:DNA-binding FrmR family transcriptional regulator
MPVLQGKTGMADGKSIQDVEARLARIEGQVRGIRSMAAEGRECVDIVTQIAAVRAAHKKVADMMVAEHVERWLNEPRVGEDRKRSVEELLKVFNQYYR